ncbi:MAG: hypothetical protein LBP65_01545 [Puniceicoccales bacterium]|nr:hypothetical protein [Puniceicoccales bacterium]
MAQNLRPGVGIYFRVNFLASLAKSLYDEVVPLEDFVEKHIEKRLTDARGPGRQCAIFLDLWQKNVGIKAVWCSRRRASNAQLKLASAPSAAPPLPGIPQWK